MKSSSPPMQDLEQRADGLNASPVVDADRRLFLQGCVAVATLASAPIGRTHSATTCGAASVQAPLSRHIALVLIDERVEEARAFAAPFHARGATVLSVTHADLEQLWRHELARACAKQQAIAGLTAHSALFVSAGLAREYGASVRYEGQHDCRGRDVLTHTLTAGKRPANFGRALALATGHWPEVLATNLAELPYDSEPLSDEYIRTDTRRSASYPGTLFSWVIA